TGGELLALRGQARRRVDVRRVHATAGVEVGNQPRPLRCLTRKNEFRSRFYFIEGSAHSGEVLGGPGEHQHLRLAKQLGEIRSFRLRVETVSPNGLLLAAAPLPAERGSDGRTDRPALVDQDRR